MKAHWPSVAITVALVLVAMGVLFVLRPVLVEAPEAVFPLILLIVIGGSFAVAWAHRRREPEERGLPTLEELLDQDDERP